MSEVDEIHSKMLATLDDKKRLLEFRIGNKTGYDLKKYIIDSLKDGYVKPKRLWGRKEDEEYNAPLGLFNLGNNSMYYKPMEKRKKTEEKKDNEEIKVENHVKMVDGKLVFTEEEQGDEDAEEKRLMFNIEVKNDIPYQIYKQILINGRLTAEELRKQFGALDENILMIIVNDMIAKRYLKRIKETEKDIEFHDTDNLDELTTVTEREVETFEIIGEKERKLVLDEK